MADNVSLAERIRVLHDLNRKAVEIPEWGDAIGDASLFVQELSGRDQVELLGLGAGEDDPSASLNAAILVVVRSLVTADGERVFTDDDVEWLRGKSATVVNRLASEAMAISTLDVEEAAGN